MDAPQQTLDGDEVNQGELLADKMGEDVSFHYYSTNYKPILHDSKQRFKNDCIEEAIEFFELSSNIRTDDFTEEELEDFAEQFVETIFDSVWDMIDSEGYSLWVQFGDKMEMPIYVKAPLGLFTSSSRGGQYGEGREDVSEDFLKAVGQMTKQEYGGWSNCSEELYEELAETEKELFKVIRNAFVGTVSMSPEIVMMIEKGKKLL